MIFLPSIVLLLCGSLQFTWAHSGPEINHRVKRGNYGERYSGGLGAQSSLGNGYGGTNVAGHQFSGVSGPQVLFDSLALKTVSVPNNAFVSSYQAQINSQASSGAGLDYLQQQGQHSAAYAGLAANQVGQWYNTIATGHVPSGYKGENRRK